jgi:hypothetical protein
VELMLDGSSVSALMYVKRVALALLQHRTLDDSAIDGIVMTPSASRGKHDERRNEERTDGSAQARTSGVACATEVRDGARQAETGRNTQRDGRVARLARSHRARGESDTETR